VCRIKPGRLSLFLVLRRKSWAKEPRSLPEEGENIKQSGSSVWLQGQVHFSQFCSTAYSVSIGVSLPCSLKSDGRAWKLSVVKCSRHLHCKTSHSLTSVMTSTRKRSCDVTALALLVQAASAPKLRATESTTSSPCLLSSLVVPSDAHNSSSMFLRSRLS
jgi:hypothetical protein